MTTEARPICLADMGYGSCQHPAVYTPAGIRRLWSTGPNGKWKLTEIAAVDMHCALCNAEYDWQYMKAWRGGSVGSCIQYQYLPKDYNPRAREAS